MEEETINYIKNNPLIYNYLREDSSWYPILMDEPEKIKELEETAKKFYKQTPEAKIEKIKEGIELIKTFMDVIN